MISWILITWILGGILVVWLLYNRYSQDGKVEGEPLGMPRGTVRAFITIMIVSFPLGYLIDQRNIPPLIVNAIFIVVAFYFEARKSSQEKLKQIVNEIKHSEKVSISLLDEKKPLYLPKYTVRFSLVVLLVVIQVMIFMQPALSFEMTNTLADVLLIVSFFMIGAFFRSIASSKEKRKIKAQIKNMDASLSDVEIIEKIMLNKQSWWKRKSKNILSVVTLAVITTALLFYTFDFDFTLFTSPYYTLTLQGTLLLLVNVYYGFRD